MNSFLLYICLVFAFITPTNPKLTLTVNNIKPIQGHIVIAVFNTETNFLKEEGRIKKYTMPVTKNTQELVITDLPYGEFAISIYHDENSDGEFNRNYLGIPKEPYGFSNNVKPRFSAPKYKDCKFLFNENKTLTINMIN
ncbi:DUF2141 domain-containing protein [Bizionia sediminis]|uniref:DUF2141 domain-containing protein n=1 Tax=Bizionia sediminis TaxID=1737064 RepID=A0ABW5KTJ4_9FLAO